MFGPSGGHPCVGRQGTPREDNAAYCAKPAAHQGPVGSGLRLAAPQRLGHCSPVLRGLGHLQSSAPSDVMAIVSR
eukprot:scaffold3968_cov359-Prasinococcus_capsulatus_cf.AAC.7